MDSWHSLAMKYGDNKMFKLMFECFQMTSLAEHTYFLMGLHGVKGSANGMSMALLLKIARERNSDDVFIEWANEFTPYKYSSKKNRFVNKNGGSWQLNDAFNNPHLCNTEFLLAEVEKFSKQERLSEPLDLGQFFDHVLAEIQRLDQTIDERLKANCARKGKKFPVEFATQAVESAQDSDQSLDKHASFAEQQRLIKQYLSRNPLPDSVGPMGLPQSKYRYGTYGLGSMEYDAWSRS
ncbi:hypothetical protein [Halomonas sp. 707B3]|uniref:hypothetical protein n=1 Tax=Halomonas sp. 707B3 TaxID=1681043 RepID=UPI00209F8BA5|nr:hypothetical protein [Halomonas sp. 707B3]MCP1318110.1 hypothetical protein [Halomonas sp. 707B3]